MLRYLCRLPRLRVVFGFHVIPGKLAESCQSEPGSEHREVMQCFGFLFKCGNLVVYHIHEDQPGFVMLGTFVGHCIPALLCKRFLGDILGIFQPFVLHADVLHELRISPSVPCKNFFHFPDTLACNHSESFPS